MATAHDTELARQELFCIECREWYDIEFFRLNSDSRAHACARKFHRGICIGCEGEARQKQREADPFIRKAQSTTERHAKKYGMTKMAFIEKYGWHLNRVAELLRQAYEHDCKYCWQPYTGMPGGYHALTLDIRDPREPPYLTTNVVPCCESCNKAKGKKSPSEWARRLISWAKWVANKMKRPPPPGQCGLPWNGTIEVLCARVYPRRHT